MPEHPERDWGDPKPTPRPWWQTKDHFAWSDDKGNERIRLDGWPATIVIALMFVGPFVIGVWLGRHGL